MSMEAEKNSKRLSEVDVGLEAEIEDRHPIQKAEQSLDPLSLPMLVLHHAEAMTDGAGGDAVMGFSCSLGASLGDGEHEEEAERDPDTEDAEGVGENYYMSMITARYIV
ncbi:hypothetical protein EDD22DRAFT_954728 [Suillus occidentalis]|nr:hypothetical protein EDD22DRAFT_954728 [Suillus occidentalis]